MNHSDPNLPPIWAQRFLRWFCKPELWEHIAGDLEESFQENLQHYSRATARRKFTMEVLGLFRPGIIRHFDLNAINFTSMNLFTNYVKVGLRQIRKNALFSSLNILGLSLSMAVCLLVIMILIDQYSFDSFQAKGDRIFRVISGRGKEDMTTDQIRQFYATAPIPIGEELLEKQTGVEAVLRMKKEWKTELNTSESIISTHGLFVDANFFDVFSFSSDPAQARDFLVEPYTLVLTQHLANKLYGEKNPVGKLVELGTTKKESYLVTGVIPDPPNRTHVKFEFLASMATLEAKAPDNFVDWGRIWDYYVYLLLDSPTEEVRLNKSLNAIAQQRSNSDPYYVYRFESQSIRAITPRDERVTGNEMGNPSPVFVLYFLIGLGGIIMLSACFNYTNLSIARSLKRAREVGVRKVIGGRKGQIFTQFLVESTLMALFSLLLALFILEFLIPMFYSLDPHLTQIFYLEKSPKVYGIFLLFSISIGILAGYVPAAHLSKYQPIEVLKSLSQVKLFSFVGLRKALITVQFLLCLVFVISSVLMLGQYRLLLRTDHGFAIENIINIDLQQQPYAQFVHEVEQIAEVIGVSGSQVKAGTGTNYGASFYLNGRRDSVNMQANSVSQNYVENLSHELVAGQNFPKNASKDREQFILLNEKAVKLLDLGSTEAAIGKAVELKLDVDSSIWLTVTGVVKDFYSRDVTRPIVPYAIRMNYHQILHANVRINAYQTEETVAKLTQAWEAFDPLHPIQYSFYSDEIAGRYKPIEAGSKIVSLVGIMSIVIACMGLLGMVTYVVKGRVKEVGIRKVLGATERELVWKLAKSFILLLGIATLIAIPLAIGLNSLWLEAFPLRITISLKVIALSTMGILLLSGGIVFLQTYLAAKGNPVEALRSE